MLETSKKNSRPRSPWITKELCARVRVRSEMYKKFLRGAITKQEYTCYRNSLTLLLRTAKENYFKEFFIKNKRNTKVVWKTINSLSPHQKECIQDIDPEAINTFFANLGKSTVSGLPMSTNDNYLKHIPRCSHTFFLAETDFLEVYATIARFAPKHSAGSGLLSAKLIHEIAHLIADPLAHIINLSFRSGVFPDDLKIAKVFPIFKGGDNSQLLNSRPISVLTIFSKVFERILYDRLIMFFDKYKLLSPCQFGFRKVKSTEQAVMQLFDFVTHNLDNHLSVFSLFVDVSKAFDSVDHTILLHKLECYGVRGNVLKWFTNYLCNRMQYVVSKNTN